VKCAQIGFSDADRPFDALAYERNVIAQTGATLELTSARSIKPIAMRATRRSTATKPPKHSVTSIQSAGCA